MWLEKGDPVAFAVRIVTLKTVRHGIVLVNLVAFNIVWGFSE